MKYETMEELFKSKEWHDFIEDLKARRKVLDAKNKKRSIEEALNENDYWDEIHSEKGINWGGYDEWRLKEE